MWYAKPLSNKNLPDYPRPNPPSPRNDANLSNKTPSICSPFCLSDLQVVPQNKKASPSPNNQNQNPKINHLSVVVATIIRPAVVGGALPKTPTPQLQGHASAKSNLQAPQLPNTSPGNLSRHPFALPNAYSVPKTPNAGPFNARMLQQPQGQRTSRGPITPPCAEIKPRHPGRLGRKELSRSPCREDRRDSAGPRREGVCPTSSWCTGF